MLLRVYLVLVCLFTWSLTQNKVGMYEQRGSYLPLDMELLNEYNQKIKLKDIVDNKPTIITINYFNCPSLCSPQLAAVASVLNKLDLQPYLDYKTITISIDPNDNPTFAKQKKDELLTIIKKPFPVQTWSFLTTNQINIDAITTALGFEYEKRIKDGIVDYLHPVAIVIVTPEGKISRYLNGITYLPFDLKLALIEANQEKANPTIAKTLLYCFAYDAKSKTYVFQAEKVLGSFMFAIVFMFFIYLVKTGRKIDKDGQDD